MIAQAAGIVSVLAEADLDSGTIAFWFGQPRRELQGLSPRDALEITPAAQGTVLRLARADVADLAARARPLEGSL